MKNEPITVTIKDAMHFSGLGRTKLYELMGQGRLKSINVGKRRLILYGSLKMLLLSGVE